MNQYEKVNIYSQEEVKKYMIKNNIMVEFSLVKFNDGTLSIKVVGKNYQIVEMIIQASNEDQNINDLLFTAFALG